MLRTGNVVGQFLSRGPSIKLLFMAGARTATCIRASHPRATRDSGTSILVRGSFQPVPGTRYGPSALTTPEADEAWTPMTCRRRRREPGLAAAACVHGAAALTTSQPDIQLTTFMETMAFTAWREATSPWGLPCLDQAHLVELEDRWPASARGVGAVMTS